MIARMNNLQKFEKSMVNNDREGVMSALTHDFGGKENARVVLAYLTTAASAQRLNNRIGMAVAFVSGGIVTMIVGLLVRIFAG